MRAMNIQRYKLQLLLVVLATLVFWIWTHLISRQHIPLLLFSVSLVVFGLISFGSWRRSRNLALILRILSGACIGYLASMVASAVVTFLLYGSGQFFDRFFPSSLYVYPLLSLGWLYGMTVFAIFGFFDPDRFGRGGQTRLG